MPVGARHGLGLLVLGEGGQVGGQPGYQVGVSVDEHEAWRSAGSFRDVDLAEDARRQPEQPGNGAAYCEDHDLGTYYACLRGVRTSSLERLGAPGGVGGGAENGCPAGRVPGATRLRNRTKVL
ncbi:MAG: hypothetical protein M3Y33_09725 [Actinomycetota bacterium]|nr:hypothetical protein [Actinomycetota bacterium]